MQEQYLTTQIGILSEALKNLQASVNALSISEPLKFFGKQTINQNIPDAVSTVIQFNADIDTHNSFNSSTNKYIIPEQGTYFISTCIGISSVTAAAGDPREWSVFINKNGTIISKGYLATPVDKATDDHDSTCITTMVNLDVNDEIQITISGGDGDANNSTESDATNLSIIKF